MIKLNVEQGSDEWFEARIGIPTASIISKIVTTKGAFATSYKTELNKLVAEYAMNKKSETYQSEAMLRGIELEPEARAWYEFVRDVEVEEVGLVYKNQKREFSCSPDGLMKDRGLEIKCPMPHTQVEYLLGGVLPTKYYQQVQMSMFVTGLKKWDFLSYHPDLPKFLITVEADKMFHVKLRDRLAEFTKALKEAKKKIEAMK